MDGVKHFSILVWALPEGAIHVDDVPRSSPARATYIQHGGSTKAMTIEIRITHEDGSYEQYAVAREPVTDPTAWTTVSWDNRGPELFTIKAPTTLRLFAFEGNRAETTTIIPVVEAFQAAHGIEELVIVAGAGMLSATNLTALDEASRGSAKLV